MDGLMVDRLMDGFLAIMDNSVGLRRANMASLKVMGLRLDVVGRFFVERLLDLSFLASVFAGLEMAELRFFMLADVVVDELTVLSVGHVASSGVQASMSMDSLVVLRRDVVLERFHLDDEVSSVGVDIGGVKDTAVGLEGTTLLVPPVLVKLVEVISPFMLERLSVRVVPLNFNVVKEDVPRHVGMSKVGSPLMESWRPHVHFELRGFMHKVDC